VGGGHCGVHPTSVSILSSNEPFGLGYIRTKAGGLGLKVEVGKITGEVVDVPFLTRGYLAETAAEK
jgi:hypothetical protein